jgi:AcrR family transcriptional regulator
MPSSSQSVQRRGYHHGDLKNALREAASRLMAEHGIDRVSLREISVAAGVSHSAAYRHYADKRALLADLAQAGFEQLAQINRDTIASTPGGTREQLKACGRAYVRFGMQRPALLQLMFGTAVGDWRDFPQLQRVAEELAGTLTGIVLQGQADGEFVLAEPGDVTLAAWSIVHGLTLLLLGRRVPVDEIDEAFVEHAAQRCTELLIDGLRSGR